MAVPSTLTDSYDALLTTTMRNYLPRLRDNITRGNRVLRWLQANGRVNMQDGGERVAIPLMHQQNSTADIYSGYGQLDTTPQDGITTAFYEWTQMSVSVSIARKEERQNSGRHRMLSLLGSKMMQAEVALQELLNNCITSGRITSGASADEGEFSARVGRLDSGATGPLPITALADNDADRSRTDIGNINPTTHAFWRNQEIDSGATTFQGLLQDMNTMFQRCSRGVGGSPDLLVGDEIAWNMYWGALQANERYMRTAPQPVDVLGGSEALMFRQAPFIWDEVVPDTKTNADVIDSIGTITLSNIFFLNSNALEFICDSQTNFVNTPFVRPTDQDARTAQILWMGALGTGNRRKLGNLNGILQTINS